MLFVPSASPSCSYSLLSSSLSVCLSVCLTPLQLFDRPGVPLSAAPDVAPPDRFNAGVMVVTPDARRFEQLLLARADTPSYDGGDTGSGCLRVSVTCQTAQVSLILSSVLSSCSVLPCQVS